MLRLLPVLLLLLAVAAREAKGATTGSGRTHCCSTDEHRTKRPSVIRHDERPTRTKARYVFYFSAIFIYFTGLSVFQKMLWRKRQQ